MEITNLLSTAIINKTPISFSKYGDGEYFCANSHNGHNCDNDNYTEKLRNGLIESFKYMVNNTDNSYIGFWHHDSSQKLFWEKIVEKKVKWAKYHTIIMDPENRIEKVNLYKTIKQSNLKKILVSNPLLLKAKLLFNIDYMLTVPFNNWFDEKFEILIGEFKKLIDPNEQYIVITCAGMGAKVLICELTKLFPNNIYLDFGSAIDKICTKKTSRGWEPSYEELVNDLSEIIPSNWNDTKFEEIYKLANKKLGIHL